MRWTVIAFAAVAGACAATPKPNCVVKDAIEAPLPASSVSPRHVQIDGVVRTCAGAPAAKIMVVATLDYMAAWITAVTDENGEFTLLLPGGGDGSSVELTYFARCGEPATHERSASPCASRDRLLEQLAFVRDGAVTRVTAVLRQR